MNEIAFALTVWAVAVLGLVRNSVTYRARARRIQVIAAANRADIRAAKFQQLDRRWEDFDAVSYESMCLDLRRWTYEQFYPEAP